MAAAAHAVHGEVEAGGVEAIDQVDGPGQVAGAAVGADAVLAPGGGEDGPFQHRPLRGEEGVRLVGLIDEAHRQEEQAAGEVQRLAEACVDARELDRGLVAVFVLDFAVEGPDVVELVAEVEHHAVDVELVGLA